MEGLGYRRWFGGRGKKMIASKTRPSKVWRMQIKRRTRDRLTANGRVGAVGSRGIETLPQAPTNPESPGFVSLHSGSQIYPKKKDSQAHGRESIFTPSNHVARAQKKRGRRRRSSFPLATRPCGCDHAILVLCTRPPLVLRCVPLLSSDQSSPYKHMLHRR